MKKMLLALLIWTACTPGFATSQAQQAEAPPQAMFTNLDQIGITTANVVTGLRTLLEGFEFDKDATLKLALNPGRTFNGQLKTMKDYREAFKTPWVNAYNLEINASFSPLGSSDEQRNQLGDWSAGLKWALFDNANPMSKKYLDMLTGEAWKATAEGLKNQKGINENTLNQFLVLLLSKLPVTEFQQTWEKAAAELRKDIEDGSFNCEVFLGKQLKPAAPGKQTERDAAIEAVCYEWDKIGNEAVLAAASPHLQKLKKLEEEVKGGLTWSFSLGFADDVTVSGSGEAESKTHDRTVEIGTILTHRRFFKTGALDLSFQPVQFRINSDDDSTYWLSKLAVSGEFLHDQINKSSILFSLDASYEDPEESDKESLFKIQEQLSVPLASNVNLLAKFSHERPEGGKWDTTRMLTLSWSWEKNGKKETQEIGFFNE